MVEKRAIVAFGLIAMGLAACAGNGNRGGANGTQPTRAPCGRGAANDLLITSVDDPNEAVVTDYNPSLPNIPQEIVYQHRSPTWFTLGDGSGTIVLEFAPVSGTPIAGNLRATHVIATGFSSWADFGIAFQPVQAPDGGPPGACFYDLSAYRGISFYGRAVAEATTLRAKIPTARTASSDQNGLCTNNCWDDYGENLQFTTDWQQFTMLFANMAQEGWGSVQPWDPTVALTIEFISNGNHPNFDVDVDQLEFVAP